MKIKVPEKLVDEFLDTDPEDIRNLVEMSFNQFKRGKTSDEMREKIIKAGWTPQFADWIIPIIREHGERELEFDVLRRGVKSGWMAVPIACIGSLALGIFLAPYLSSSAGPPVRDQSMKEVGTEKPSKPKSAGLTDEQKSNLIAERDFDPGPPDAESSKRGNGWGVSLQSVSPPQNHIPQVKLPSTPQSDPPTYTPTPTYTPPQPTAVPPSTPTYIPRVRISEDYLSPGSGHWIESVSSDGQIVKLEDGSVWEVDSIDQIDSSLWLATEDIVVVEESDGYLLINTDSNNEKVHAKLLKQ